MLSDRARMKVCRNTDNEECPSKITYCPLRAAVQASSANSIPLFLSSSSSAAPLRRWSRKRSFFDEACSRKCFTIFVLPQTGAGQCGSKGLQNVSSGHSNRRTFYPDAAGFLIIIIV